MTITDGHPQEFARLQEDLHLLIRRARDTYKLKLLNVGTDHEGEHHWRFKTSSGQIIILKIEIENVRRST